MKCLRCNRNLKTPGQTIGKICARKNAGNADGGAGHLRVEPLTTSPDYHSYLVFTTPRRIVKIYNAGSFEKTADCQCNPSSICEHIAAAAKLDAVRFSEVAKCL